MTDKKDNVVIFRSRVTTMAAAIDGLLTGLVSAAQAGQSTSIYSVKLFTTLYGQLRKLTKEVGLEEWPALDENVTLGDLIAASSTLRSLYLFFFTPEQIAEYREVSAFKMAEFDRSRRQ